MSREHSSIATYWGVAEAEEKEEGAGRGEGEGAGRGEGDLGEEDLMRNNEVFSSILDGDRSSSKPAIFWAWQSTSKGSHLTFQLHVGS